MQLNCWEVKQCGYQPGGNMVDELGICPASTETRLHGINGGINGGRACWPIKNTLCGNTVQRNFSEKLELCLSCDFYSRVKDEEGANFMMSKEILAKLKD